MKITRSHTVGFFDIDHRKTLHLSAAARMFQDMATRHSIAAGDGPDQLFSRGKTWLLHRLEMDFTAYPRLGESITISTWSRGFKHHQGLRDYCIESNRGLLARASSVWIYFDFIKKRIQKVSPEVGARYGAEPDSNFPDELKDWKPCGKITADHEIAISLRYSDFDLNDHVNNTIYPGFVETLFHTRLNQGDTRIRNLKIRFSREIPRSETSVCAGASQADGQADSQADSRCLFNVRSSGGTVYADGEFTPV